MSDYKLLRTTVDLTDDDDHALLQTTPGGLVLLPRGFVSAAESFDEAKIEFMLEWLDAAGDRVLGGRGSFNATILRSMNSPATTDGTAVVIVDSVSLPGLAAYRPFIITDIVPGDEYSVRLDTMVGPGGTETHARILFREFI